MYVHVYVYIQAYTRVCMHDCQFVHLYIYVCIKLCMYVYTRIYVCICMYVGVHVCVGVLEWALRVYLYVLYVLVACCSISDSFGDIRTVAGDPDPIRIRARCEPDTQAIRRPVHEMICRTVPVRVVKTRWRFGFETASFHVSVCSYVFTVVGMYLHVTLIISCEFLSYFTSSIACTTL